MFYYYFKEYEIKDDTINITLLRTVPDGDYMYTCDYVMCTYILEIDKDQVAYVTQINVNEIEVK